MFLRYMEFVRLDQNNHSLDLLTEVGTQRERAILVQLLVTSPAHGIAHSLYITLSSNLQSLTDPSSAAAATATILFIKSLTVRFGPGFRTSFEVSDAAPAYQSGRIY